MERKSSKLAVRNLRLCTKDCLCLFICPTGATDTENSVIDPEKCVGVISVDFLHRDNAEIAYRLEEEYGILVRCGLHCAPDAHKALGTFPDGTVRFSFSEQTTEKELETAVNAIRKFA